MVFDALTKPEILRRWFFGPDGWTLAVCEIDLCVGGRYRYVWRGQDGTEMGMGGVFQEIVPPERIVATGKFDVPWYPGEELGTMVFVEKGGKTTLTHTVRYETKEARDAVLASGAMAGVEMGYDRLADMLSEEA
jgi:uncharacterized protein YndB with AHSA1/START domain